MNIQLKPYAPITRTPSGEDDNLVCWRVIDTMKQRGYTDRLAFGVAKIVRAYLADARGIAAGDAVADAGIVRLDPQDVIVPTCGAARGY